MGRTRSTPPAPTAAPRRARWLGGALFGLVLVVFLPVVRHDFICYDDNGYVTHNAWVQKGLTLDGIKQAFRTTEIAYWHPLTWLSHMTDVQLFGLNPAGHHFTSVLWHALNALLLFVVLRKMTGATWRSVLVAALFGLHPLHVESVAWVAERKDVLSTFFLFLALLSYAHWVQARAAGRARSGIFYGLSLLAFAGGLMSKPMVVTLPCVLLLLDVWPLNRWGAHTGETRLAVLGRLVLEKLPFFFLSAATSVLAVVAQDRLGTLNSTQIPLPARLLNALAAYLKYLEKCFWPAKLAIFYPYPATPPVGAAIFSALVLAGITLVAWRWRKTAPWFAVGWLFFLGTLVPVIGLVQVGAQAMADRYSYVPLVGVFIIVAWGGAEVATRQPQWGLGLRSAAVVALLALTLVTLRQLGYWKDSPTIFTHALDVTERNWTAHLGLGYYHATQPGHDAEALAEYRETVALAPALAAGHFSLGTVLARDPRRLSEAVVEYEEALRLDPRSGEAWFGLGQALRQLPGRANDAIKALETAVRLEPENTEAAAVLGDVLAREPDRLADAVRVYESLLRLRPDWIEVRNNLGSTLAQIPGREAEAITQYRDILAAHPDAAMTHNNLANALARLGQYDAAIAEYRAALRFQPGYAMAELNLGMVLLNQGGHDAEAASHFENALRLQPDLTPARQMLERLRGAGKR